MILEEHLTNDDADRKSDDVKAAVNFDPANDALSKREYQREDNRRLWIFEEFRSRHVSHCDQIRTAAVRFSREDNHYPANQGSSTVYPAGISPGKGRYSHKRSLRPPGRPSQTR